LNFQKTGRFYPRSIRTKHLIRTIHRAAFLFERDGL
jgi:hypothetical protein